MDELITQVIALLKPALGTHNGRTIVAYYTGDPLLIPANQMPCIAVAPGTTNLQTYDQARDEDHEDLTISVITDARLDFNQTPDKVTGTAFLLDIMEGRNANGTLKTNTVRYLLRHDPTIGARVFDQTGKIEYGIKQRGSEIFTREAVYHLTAKRITTF